MKKYLCCNSICHFVGFAVWALVISVSCIATERIDAAPVDHSKDYDILLEGVQKIGVSGAPGPVCIYGSKAFPVVVGNSGEVTLPLVAAARSGKGRVVAFGHSGYISDFKVLEKNHRHASDARQLDCLGRGVSRSIAAAADVSRGGVSQSHAGRIAKATGNECREC